MGNPWGGLGRSSGSESLITDTPTSWTWYMAIGCKREWYGGIPGPRARTGKHLPVKKVELYIKRT